MRFATICTAVILLSGCATFGPKTQEYNDKFPYVEIPTPEEYRSDNYPKPVVFAKYPGGKERLTNYIRMNTRYPVEAYRDGVYGDVTITYVVGTDGRTKDIEAVESPSEDFTKMFTINYTKMDRWEACTLEW
ncbi:MAG: energy transducer TonB [Gracilimonas sp.]|nr:energy transducer TonB [Gracilimonas sp.]